MLRTTKNSSLSKTKLSKNTRDKDIINLDEMLTLRVGEIVNSNLSANFKVEHNIVKQ